VTEDAARPRPEELENPETARMPAASVKHNNEDLFIWALELAGGRDGYVDVEDVYFKCFELAPRRFAWRTRSHLPDISKLQYARRDAIKRQKRQGVRLVDALEVDLSEGKSVPAHQWRLTAAGAEWCDLYRERLTALYGGSSVPASPRQVESRRIRELRTSALFEQWASGDSVKPSRIQVADLLECSPGSEKKVFDLRLDQALEDAQKLDDSATVRFVEWLRTNLEESDATT
jgi:hypothetical protein